MRILRETPYYSAPLCGDTLWLYDAVSHYKLNHPSEVEPTHFDVQHEKNKLKVDLMWFPEEEESRFKKFAYLRKASAPTSTSSEAR